MAEIVLRPLKMLANEIPYLLTQPVRQKRYCQDCDSKENEERLNLKRCCTSSTGDNLRKNTDEKKVAADHQQCDGGVQNGARWVNINLAKSSSKVADCEEQTANEQAGHFHLAQRICVPGKYQRLTAGIDASTEDYR